MDGWLDYYCHTVFTQLTCLITTKSAIYPTFVQRSLRKPYVFLFTWRHISDWNGKKNISSCFLWQLFLRSWCYYRHLVCIRQEKTVATAPNGYEPGFPVQFLAAHKTCFGRIQEMRLHEVHASEPRSVRICSETVILGDCWRQPSRHAMKDGANPANLPRWPVLFLLPLDLHLSCSLRLPTARLTL